MPNHDDDIIELLPADAAARLRAFRRDADDAAAVVRNIVTRTLEVRERRQSAEARLRYVTRPPSGRAAGEGHPGYEQAKADVDRTAAELAELANRETAASAIWNLRAGIVRDIERELRDKASRRLAFQMAPAIEPHLLKGEDVIAGIERCRREVRRLQADLHEVRSAPLLASEARAIMVAQVNALAEAGKPYVGATVETGAPVEFATEGMRTVARGEAIAYVGWEQSNALATLAWLHRDALVKKLTAEIDGESDDAAALSAADRRKRESELLADLAATKRQIGALIALADSQGLTVEHEAGVEAEVALGIVTVLAGQPAGIDLSEEILRQHRAVENAATTGEAIAALSGEMGRAAP